MQQLITIQNNKPTVSAITIADNTNNQYKSIRDLITKFSNELEEFGELNVTDLKSATDALGRKNKPKTVALLNESQAIFLMTLLKNSSKVVKFKVLLVKEFHSLKNSKGLQGRVGGLTRANYSYKKYINKLLNDIKLLENKQKQIPNKCVLDFKVYGRNDLLEFIASVQRQEQDLNDCFKIMIHNYKITNKMMNNFLKLYPEVNPDSKSRTFTDY